MAGRILREIRQTKPFDVFEEELVLNIVRTAELLGRQTHDFLKDYELSEAQYNLLRILRGAQPTGRTCSEIGERMVSRDPDITRLVDRLEARGLVVRQRNGADRRIVLTRITKEGVKLLSSIDSPLRDWLLSTIGKMNRGQQQDLVSGLDKVRELLQLKFSGESGPASD